MGVVYVTADGGQSWTRHIVRESFRPFVCEFASADEGWLAGDWVSGSHIGQILHTTDGGAHWAVQRTPSTYYSIVRDLDFSDPSRGWAVGCQYSGETPQPFTLSTEDGGVTWKERSEEIPTVGEAVRFVDPQHGRIVGSGVWRTDDGGSSWRCEVPAADMTSLAQLSMDEAWAAGDGMLVTADTADDVSPPATLVSDNGRRWHKLPYSLPLSATEIGAGSVAVTEYRIDGESAWGEAIDGTVTFQAEPGDHSFDGLHHVYYRSIDDSGNMEPWRLCELRIDTTPPVTIAPKAVVTRRGSWGILPYRVIDIPGIWGTVTVKIRRLSDGACVKTIRESWEGDTAVWFKCWLATARYRFTVYATDAAGNTQATAGSNLLTVKPAR